MTYFTILADQGILDALLKGVILNPGQFGSPWGSLGTHLIATNWGAVTGRHR